MNETNEEKRNLLPHIAAIVVIVVVLLAILLWPKADDPVAVQPQPTEPEPVVEPVLTPEPEPEPVVFEAAPEPVEAAVEDLQGEEEVFEVVEETPLEPEPLDLSDKAIAEAIGMLVNNTTVAEMLITDGLLQRFVVTSANLAEQDMAPNHQLVQPPMQTFRVYTQADKQWIDAASYKRYTPYVDMLEEMETESLLTLFETYQPEMQRMYDEFGMGSDNFYEVVIEAIDVLLDTPEVPVPIEVYTDSVMYKFADERLEELSAPKKQLLRMGPDNMRRVKAKLRDVKDALMEQYN